MPPSIRPASILITNTPPFRAVLEKLAQSPQRSWQRFKLGLSLFVVGAMLIVTGAALWVWLQVPGIILLAIGFGTAAWGYLGLLANRLVNAFRLPASRDDRAK